MLRFLFALLALLPALLGAQTLERSFGLELTPHLGEQRISNSSNVTATRLERLDSLESGRPGFAIGLTYESRVDRIGYTTGLRYLRLGYETLQQEVPGAPDQRYADVVTANYLSLPFEVNFYQDVTENDRALFLLGVNGQYHLGTRTQRTTFTGGAESGSERLAYDASQYRPIIIAFVAGIGYDRKLSTDWALRVQPTFQFFLNGALRPETDAPANRNYYQLGLRLVLRRLFI